MTSDAVSHSTDDTRDVRPGDGRAETENERADRNWLEELQEQEPTPVVLALIQEAEELLEDRKKLDQEAAATS